jgi:hypothetical protein
MTLQRLQAHLALRRHDNRARRRRTVRSKTLVHIPPTQSGDGGRGFGPTTEAGVWPRGENTTPPVGVGVRDPHFGERQRRPGVRRPCRGRQCSEALPGAQPTLVGRPSRAPPRMGHLHQSQRLIRLAETHATGVQTGVAAHVRGDAPRARGDRSIARPDSCPSTERRARRVVFMAVASPAAARWCTRGVLRSPRGTVGVDWPANRKEPQCHSSYPADWSSSS